MHNIYQRQVGCTPNQKVWGSNPLRSKRRKHFSAFDFRWLCDISGKIDDLSLKSPISRDLSRNIDPYFSMKYRVDTFRYTIYRCNGQPCPLLKLLPLQQWWQWFRHPQSWSEPHLQFLKITMHYHFHHWTKS